MGIRSINTLFSENLVSAGLGPAKSFGINRLGLAKRRARSTRTSEKNCAAGALVAGSVQAARVPPKRFRHRLFDSRRKTSSITASIAAGPLPVEQGERQA